MINTHSDTHAQTLDLLRRFLSPRFLRPRPEPRLSALELGKEMLLLCLDGPRVRVWALQKGRALEEGSALTGGRKGGKKGGR